MRRTSVASVLKFSRQGGNVPQWASPGARRDADVFYSALMGLRPSGGAATGRLLPWNEAAEAAPVTLPAGFRMGVWVDVGGRSIERNGREHASRLHALGITDACIMINPLTSLSFGFGSVSQTRIRGFGDLLRGSAIRLTLTSWLRPNRNFIDDLVRDLPPFAKDVGARAIEFDVEEPWTRHAPSGFGTHDEAADHLFTGLRTARAAGLEVAVTCQVDAMGTARMRKILEHADVIVPQAYSTPGAAASHAVGGTYGPRGLQRRAAERVATALAMSGKPIVMGLAAYGRTRWSGHSGRAIMTFELDETVTLAKSHPIRGARYWSWKHIAGINGQLGTPANPYARGFLQDVALPPP
jgi:hypothetical protein